MTTHIRIKKVAGIPRLFVNGKAMAGIAYHNRQNEFYPYMKQFADSGTELFFSYYVRNWNESWEEHFAKVACQVDTILAFNDRIYVILGLYLSASQEWARENPEELCRSDGRPCMTPYRIANTEKWESDSGCTSAAYSFASEKFDAVAKDHIDRHLDFLEGYRGKDRVIGLFFSGGSTHEWNPFTPDLGPAGLKAYRQYVIGKYRNTAALRKCWADKNASFASVAAPTPAELACTPVGYYYIPQGQGQKVVDWHLAMAEAKSRRMLNAARAIKDRRPELLVGCFHGNHYRDPGVTQRILESNDIDFLVSPPQYHARSPGQHSALNQMVDSFHSYGKLFFSEEDIFPYDDRSWNYASDPTRRIPHQGDAKCLADTLAVCEKGFGQTIAKGTMAWYYHFQEEFFKRDPRYFELNRRMLAVSMLNIKKKCRSSAQILVVSDECSFIHLKPGTRVVQKQVDRELVFELGYIGAPYDVMFMDALGAPGVNFSRYKLIFFLNLHMATKKQRQIVDRLKSEGRTIIFGHGAGFLADDGAGVENMKALTGFDFEQLDLEWTATITTIDTPNPINRYLPLGYAFGQSYRAKRIRADGKGAPLFPPPANTSPVFAVADRQAVDIGFYNLELPEDFKTAAQTKGALPYCLPGFKHWPRYFVGLALKEHKDWSALYIGTPTVPTALLRAICKYAGVHLYVESDDIIYGNNKLLVLHTNEKNGPRQLRFPKKTNVYDLKTEKQIASGANCLTLDCPARRTWLLWLDTSSPFGRRQGRKGSHS
ncbi:MAG: hypothetical protein PHW60_05265 [Kiritimatiellae bacterium]|nr:hypothetical protein [Kiritimatiellia bacterium]